MATNAVISGWQSDWGAGLAATTWLVGRPQHDRSGQGGAKGGGGAPSAPPSASLQGVSMDSGSDKR